MPGKPDLETEIERKATDHPEPLLTQQKYPQLEPQELEEVWEEAA